MDINGEEMTNRNKGTAGAGYLSLKQDRKVGCTDNTDLGDSLLGESPDVMLLEMD